MDLATNGLPPLAFRLYTPKGQFTGERGGRFDVMKPGTPHYTLQTNKNKIQKTLVAWVKKNGVQAAKQNGVFKAATLTTGQVGKLTKEQVAHVLKAYQSVSGESTKSAETKPESPPDTKPEPKPDEKGKEAAETKPEEKKVAEGKKKDAPKPVIHQSNKKKPPREPSPEVKEMGAHIDDVLTNPDLKIKGYTRDMIKEGPRIIRFIYKPDLKASGMGAEDFPEKLSLALEEKGVTLDSPPVVSKSEDKKRVYIDIPKKTPDKVELKDVFAATESEIHNKDGAAEVPLALDIDGDAVGLDLSKSPHIKIVGGTGSGKGEVLKAIAVGLSRTMEPGTVEFALIEPKAGAFNEIKDMKTVLGEPASEKTDIMKMVAEAHAEMLRRADMFKTKGEGIVNIEGYNKSAANKIPRRVIMVDEMTSLVSKQGLSGKDLLAHETMMKQLNEIATQGRSAGVHLVLAAQMGSARNFPDKLWAQCETNICLSVRDPASSKRMLEDDKDLSALGLGKRGDGYIKLAGGPKVRVQCPFVSPTDIEEAHKYLGGKRIKENNE